VTQPLRQLDTGLFMEVERLAAADIHDAKAAICMYCNYARWLTNSPMKPGWQRLWNDLGLELTSKAVLTVGENHKGFHGL